MINQLKREMTLLTDVRQRQQDRKDRIEYRPLVCDDDTLPALMLFFSDWKDAQSYSQAISTRKHPSLPYRNLFSPITFSAWDKKYVIPHQRQEQNVDLKQVLSHICKTYRWTFLNLDFFSVK